MYRLFQYTDVCVGSEVIDQLLFLSENTCFYCSNTKVISKKNCNLKYFILILYG